MLLNLQQGFKNLPPNFVEWRLKSNSLDFFETHLGIRDAGEEGRHIELMKALLIRLLQESHAAPGESIRHKITYGSECCCKLFGDFWGSLATELLHSPYTLGP